REDGDRAEPRARRGAARIAASRSRRPRSARALPQPRAHERRTARRARGDRRSDLRQAAQLPDSTRLHEVPRFALDARARPEAQDEDMTREELVRTRDKSWARLKEMLQLAESATGVKKLGPQGISELAQLYRALAGDLMRVRRDKLGADLEQHLDM